MSFPNNPEPGVHRPSPRLDTRRPAELLADRQWRLQHSLWILGPILGLGFVTWASFLYIGARARRKDWLIASFVYTIALGVFFYFTDTTQDPNSQSNEWIGSAALALWVTGIVHALLSRKTWLRWRAHNSVPWYLEPQQQGVTAAPPNAAEFTNASPPQLSGLGLDSTPYYAPQPAANPGPPPGYPASPTPANSQATNQAGQAVGRRTTPLEINTARADQLATLPGFTDQRVRAVLAIRESQGGISSIEQFADAAGLAPHEHYRIRDVVTVTPPPPAGRSRQAGEGRVVDL